MHKAKPNIDYNAYITLYEVQSKTKMNKIQCYVSIQFKMYIIQCDANICICIEYNTKTQCTERNKI